MTDLFAEFVEVVLSLHEFKVKCNLLLRTECTFRLRLNGLLSRHLTFVLACHEPQSLACLRQLSQEGHKVGVLASYVA